MPRDFKTRLTINLALTALILAVILVLIFLLGRDIKSKAGYISSTKVSLNTRVHQLDNLARLRGEAKLAESDLPKLRAVLPKKDELLSFRQQLDQLAQENGLSMSFNFGQESGPSEKGLGSINFDMTLQGSNINIVNFIKKLETDIYFIKLLSLDIIRQEKGSNAVLKGEIFYSE